MVAFSALAEYPERIHNIFHNTRRSEAGVYAVNIYVLGVPYTTYIDDYLPFTNLDELLFAQVGSDRALWGPLLEKAIAKYVGNYWHMDTGINTDGVGFMNGGPHYYLRHYGRYDEDPDDFWEHIKHHDRRR